jgi:large subunit ribosomal protein L21
MFAVIRTGGKQYKVAKDDVLSVEKLAGEPGATIELAEVLMIGEGAEVTTGTPLLTGASVAATVLEQTRAPKIIVFKKKRRKNYRRKKGHRQHQTVLRITEIRGTGGSQSEEQIASAPQPEEQVAAIPRPEQEVAAAPQPEEQVADAPQPEEQVADAPQPEEQVVGAPQEEEPTHGA